MKQTTSLFLVLFGTLWLMSGCSQKAPKADERKKPLGFHTDRSRFMNTIDAATSDRKERNAFIDEFIAKSDIQCQTYLNKPLTKSQRQSKSGLYMNLFDATSAAFGTKEITDSAKGLFIKNPHKAAETQMAYEKALSTEIKFGVQIARERYARTILIKKNRLIESYTIPMVEKDLQKYDKLCDYDYGLIEINNILRRAQKPKTYQPFSSKLRIDPATIRNKVEAVTIEVRRKEEKKKEKHSNKNIQYEEEMRMTETSLDSNTSLSATPNSDAL